MMLPIASRLRTSAYSTIYFGCRSFFHRATPTFVCVGSVATELLILDYVEADAPMWQLVQTSRRGVTQAAGPVCEPNGLTPCR